MASNPGSADGGSVAAGLLSIATTTKVWPDHQTVAQVADGIARSAVLTITPSTDGPLHAWLHRYATTVRAIRWN